MIHLGSVIPAIPGGSGSLGGR